MAEPALYQGSNIATSNGQVPQVSKVYSFAQTLSSGAPVTLDLQPLVNQQRINNVQGMFIDNSAGTVALNVSALGGPNVIIPATYQGMMPLYMSADNKITLAGNGTVNITLLNFPTPVNVWPTGSTVVSVSGSVNVQDTVAEGYLQNMQPGMPAITTHSITNSVNSVSTALMAANGARRYLLIQSAYNVVGAVFHDLWVNPLGGTAGVGLVDCIRVAAGTIWEPLNVSQSAINYFDAVGGNQITAYDG